RTIIGSIWPVLSLMPGLRADGDGPRPLRVALGTGKNHDFAGVAPVEVERLRSVVVAVLPRAIGPCQRANPTRSVLNLIGQVGPALDLGLRLDVYAAAVVD